MILASEFYLNGEKGEVASGAVFGNAITLKLTVPSAVRKLTYCDSKLWHQSNLLRGDNGIAVLTFCEVLIPPKKIESLRKSSS